MENRAGTRTRLCGACESFGCNCNPPTSNNRPDFRKIRTVRIFLFYNPDRLVVIDGIPRPTRALACSAGAELAFVVLDIAYVQHEIVDNEAFYTLMITCFWLNIAVPVTIHLWKGVYLRERDKYDELPESEPAPEIPPP